MNPSSLKEAKKIFNETKKTTSKLNGVEIIVCPPFVYLSQLGGVASKLIKLGAQDLFYEEKGSYTGEISARMLKNLKVKYVIIGHSESRKYHNETNKIINKEIKSALSEGLRVIFCIGEKKRDSKKKYLDFIKKEIEEGLNGIQANLFKNIIIAYEPIWAIGEKSKGADTPENVLQIGGYIKKILVPIFGNNLVKKIPILYGGSVDSKNVVKFLKDGGVQGLLVGRSSLNSKEFNFILKSAEKIK